VGVDTNIAMQYFLSPKIGLGTGGVNLDLIGFKMN
jgi:hypothetical protein